MNKFFVLISWLKKNQPLCDFASMNSLSEKLRFYKSSMNYIYLRKIKKWNEHNLTSFFHQACFTAFYHYNTNISTETEIISLVTVSSNGSNTSETSSTFFINTNIWFLIVETLLVCHNWLVTAISLFYYEERYYLR